ncbi:MAG: hypothetical protein JOZ77_11650 [Candidatus Eremiobacteraeota bacterium]|nr:hypothetical protein [Candidatus Eremiobacteraeota bacterium]
MPAVIRAIVVIVVGAWMLGSALPSLERCWQPYPDNGLVGNVDFDGTIGYVTPDSPAASLGIEPGDRVQPPLPADLFRDPPPTFSFRLNHDGAVRTVTIAPRSRVPTRVERLLYLALFISYFVFLVVGSMVLLLRPSPMTWSFYLYCVLRRYGDLGFYWPGSNEFYWTNLLVLSALSGATCAFVAIFALRFPADRVDGWRRRAQGIAALLSIALPIAWFCVFLRLWLGLPSQTPANALTLFTAAMYLGASAIFVVTFLQSHGANRQKLRWVLIFPVVLVLRVIAILVGDGLFAFPLPDWFPQALAILAISVPLTVAYAVVRRRVFDVEFAISRALVYAAITSLIAGTFLLLDWFMSKQFAATRFTLTAEIIVALAIGSWLNMLHRNVDRFVDSTFFRQRHLSEQRLAKAAAAVLRAESHEVVDRFLVHEPLRALDLTSAAVFHKDSGSGHFVRDASAHWERVETRELTSDDPLVLHLLAEGAPVRLADVVWGSEASAKHVGDAVLAMPVLLRDELVAIVLYGPHRSGADIDPDEIRGVVLLVERAGAAYDHIEARTLRAQVESLIRDRDAKQREIEMLRTSSA